MPAGLVLAFSFGSFVVRYKQLVLSPSKNLLLYCCCTQHKRSSNTKRPWPTHDMTQPKHITNPHI